MKHDLSDTLADLTLLGIQKTDLEPEPVKQDADAKPAPEDAGLSVEELVAHLEKIKRRMFHLLSTFAV